MTFTQRLILAARVTVSYAVGLVWIALVFRMVDPRRGSILDFAYDVGLGMLVLVLLSWPVFLAALTLALAFARVVPARPVEWIAAGAIVAAGFWYGVLPLYSGFEVVAGNWGVAMFAGAFFYVWNERKPLDQIY